MFQSNFLTSREVPSTQWMVLLGWGSRSQICNQEHPKGSVPSRPSGCSETKSRRSPVMSVKWEIKCLITIRQRAESPPPFTLVSRDLPPFNLLLSLTHRGVWGKCGAWKWHLHSAVPAASTGRVWCTPGTPASCGSRAAYGQTYSFSSFDFKDNK